MIIESVWVTKLILSHLITDFILQPKTWVDDRNAKHFSSGKLYLHGFITVVPAGPYALAYWQSKGYTLNAVGATMPTPPISDLNKADIRKK